MIEFLVTFTEPELLGANAFCKTAKTMAHAKIEDKGATPITLAH
jgi:hypothetical protein